MSAFRIIIQPEAEKDLDEIYNFLESRKQGLGFDLLEQLTELIDVLELNPFLFQKAYENKRRALISRFKCNVIFKIIKSDVFILAIMDGRRNPDIWQERK